MFYFYGLYDGNEWIGVLRIRVTDNKRGGDYGKKYIVNNVYWDIKENVILV